MQIDELKERLRTFKRLSPKDLLLIDAVLAYGGVASRGGDLFGKNSMLSKLSTTVKVRGMSVCHCGSQLLACGASGQFPDVCCPPLLLLLLLLLCQGLKGVDNVYTQHEPLLSTTLDVRGLAV